MRLRDIEEKLSSLVRSRWGSDAGVIVQLHEHSRPTLSILLPDDTELEISAPEYGSLLIEALALLARHLEAMPPPQQPPEAPGDFKR